MKRWGKQPPLHFDEKELKTDLGKGNFIFVGSSCDMFAKHIPYEWKKEYNDDRPLEPCCASESPEQWADITSYAEDKLKEAFDAGYQNCLNEYGWHFLKDEDLPPQEDKEYLFYLAAKNERGMIISDTWERKRNNPYVIAWAEFQTLKV